MSSILLNIPTTNWYVTAGNIASPTGNLYIGNSVVVSGNLIVTGNITTPASSVTTLSAVLTAGNSAGSSQIDMNSNKIINTTDPTNLQDVATKNYIDTILSGYMKQVKVERFTANGNFVVPVGVTYAIAHIIAGGGGIGTVTAGGAGGNSSVAFVGGTQTAIGGAGTKAMNGANNVGEGRGVAGMNNTGKGASFTAVQEYNYAGNPNSYYTAGYIPAPDGQEVVVGSAVAFGQSIAIVVGVGGTAGTTSPAGRGLAGGSGYVYLEYY